MLAGVLLFSLQLQAANSHKRHSSPAPADPGYTLALSAANHFLHAWQSGDLETGVVLLSDSVRHSQNPDKFEEYFTSTGDRGFEIARGIGKHDRYRFAVALVTNEAGRIRRRFSEIVVVNSGKNNWAIDKLP